MRLHAAQGVRGTVLDLETGRPVPKVLWLDVGPDGVGTELEACRVDARGGYVRDLNGEYLTYRARGRFRLVVGSVPAGPGGVTARGPSAGGHARTPAAGAPRCALCPSPLTLPGDDLCPPCRARERGQRNRLLVERLLNPLLDRKCCNCSRLATYAVADEVAVSPQVGLWGGRKALFSRGYTAGRRWYCEFCYRPPRILDARGEVVEELEEAGGVRPQWHS
jgi:hypothetical protein